MKCKVKTIKELHTDNGKVFRKGSDVAFDVINKMTGEKDHYIGEIKSISENWIELIQVEVNKKALNSGSVILLKDIIDNSCNYVYVD